MFLSKLGQEVFHEWCKIQRKRSDRKMLSKSRENTYDRISFLKNLQAKGMQFIK